ncbi:2321_t:CDS:2, partial [Scutellospora calospora]
IPWLKHHKSPKGHLARWIIQLSKYEPYDIIKRKGRDHTNTDALSSNVEMPKISITPFLRPLMTKFVQLINLIPLNHMNSIDKVVEEMAKGKVLIITAKTGPSKSTDFIQNLTTKYSKDDEGYNVCTHGYLLALDKKFKDDDFIICIDEIHEMNEDSLILMEKYKGHVICLSAIPISVPNSVEIQLSKSRNPYHIEVIPGPSSYYLKSNVFYYLNRFKDRKRVLVIHLSYTQYLKLHDTLSKTLGKKCQIILGCRRNSKFITCPSSHAVSIQQKGRTGYMYDGIYVHLYENYIDTPFDLSISFMYNYLHLFEYYWGKKPLYFFSETSISPKIPSCYNVLLTNSDIGIYLELVYSTNVIDADLLYSRILSKRYNANTFYYSSINVVTPIEQETGKIDHKKKIKKQQGKTCILYAKKNSYALESEDINNHSLSYSICIHESDSKLKICCSYLAHNSDYKMPGAWCSFD